MSAENIWGKLGCELPNGKKCKACCVGLIVPEIPKDELTTCKHESENGCAIYESMDRPDRCNHYHCGDDSNPNRKLLLITIAEVGYDNTPPMVTHQEAEEARNRIIG